MNFIKNNIKNQAWFLGIIEKILSIFIQEYTYAIFI